MTTKHEEWRKRHAELKRQTFTKEEKERWARILHATWHAIGGDVEEAMRYCPGQKLTKALLVEAVCDANRPMDYGMTREENEFMSAIYHRPSFKRWAYKELNYV